MRLTPVGARLALAARNPGTRWRVLAENVPVWPAAPPLPTADWGSHARYAPSQGIDTLLVALRERELQRGVSLTTESLLVTNGGLDGLALIARHLAATGVRRAVCGGPILLSVADLFGAIGLEVIVTELPVFTDRQAWSSCDLRPSDLVYLNTPHNPTGACLDADAVRTILDAQSQFGFSLVMDLVYDSFVHDPAACASPPALVSDWRKVYALNSFSKNYGAPGLRVGWLIAGPEEIGQLTARLEWERIAVCTDTQYQAARLCSYGNTPLVKRVQAGRELVLRWAKELGVVALPSQGGTQLWADLLVGDTEVLADELMAEHGLIMTTGANYYPADRDYIRIPYGADPALLLDSLQTIAAVQCRLRG